MVSFLSITAKRLETIKRETDGDETLQKLKQAILQGWPSDKSSLPLELYPYYNFRDELSLQNGLLFKGERVIIPASLRKEMKSSIHSSHLGVESCLRRARECLYWPGMSAELKTYISTCEPCRKFEAKQQKETLMSHELPERPWSKVGCDLFTFHDNDYVIVVDYYSNFWEVDKLGKIATSRCVINKLKAHFARHGIPEEVVTDGGPQFVSSDFRSFATTWDFDHVVTSPHHSRSNGKAESAVKSAKSIFRKCSDEGSDPLLAILEHRNTPSQGIGSSPVQRLYNRRTRSVLPIRASLLEPRSVHPSHEKTKLESAQHRQQYYYNRNAKDLPPLKEGETVRLQPYKMGDKEWKQATVQKRLDERSYHVTTPDGSSYRRNRVYLRSEQRPDEPTTQKEPTTPDQSTTGTGHHMDNDNTTKCTPYVTRSGRTINAPKRLIES